MGKKATPSTAIITGIGIIGFGLFYYFIGILPSRRGASVVTATEDPSRFGVGIVLMMLVGAACLIWGIAKSMKD
ncbi:MAG TPA: hypothetical protein VF074_11330 [Pyrinomonadaceae bacterium]